MSSEKQHHLAFAHFCKLAENQGWDAEAVVGVLQAFQVAIPSWALGAGGTRFGRFSIGGEPGNLAEKIEDVGLVHELTQCADSISLHIPWDIPEDPKAIQQLAREKGLHFDSVNSNTFQDYGQEHSYKFGSLSSSQAKVREQAIAHNQQVIDIGTSLGADVLTVWLADGSSFPGQSSFRKALEHTQESLQAIYQHMPHDWKMLIEYKPFEPHFYSMVIPDWGTSLALAQACGPKAQSLVDLGHHLPNTNIEQIVATLQWQKKLGGFHFNDSKFADDDLSVGSIKPYQLFLIFNELVQGIRGDDSISWMIDASHNLKDPLEDLIQSLESIQIALAKALLIDQKALEQARENNDVSLCQQLLQDAYQTDVRPLVAEARLRAGGVLDPLADYREREVRKQLIARRGSQTQATGL